MLLELCHGTSQAAQRSQQPEAGVRLGASLVEATFTVVDNHNQPVTNLTKDDFEVYHDGRQHEIAFFYPPTRERSSETAPLLLGLLIDISESMGPNVMEVRQAARSFIEKLPSEAQIAVFSFSEGLRVIRNFTSDRSLIEAAMMSAIPIPAGTNIYGSVAQAMELLNAYAGMMGTRRWRKVLVVISDGLDTQMVKTNQAAIDLARRSNVKIFTVTTPVPGGLGPLIAPREFVELARATGGIDFAGMETVMGLQPALNKIATVLDSEYLIAYNLAESELDGKFHRIEVKVKKKGLKVRNARLGYKALTEAEYRRSVEVIEAQRQAIEKRSELLKQYLSSPGVENQIVGSLSVGPITQLDQDHFYVPVAVKLRYESLQPRKENASYFSSFDYLVRVQSLSTSQLHEFRDQFWVRVKEEEHKKAQKGEIGFRSKLRLTRGRYLLKVAIVEVETGRGAVLETSFHVPQGETRWDGGNITRELARRCSFCWLSAFSQATLEPLCWRAIIWLVLCSSLLRS